MADQVYYKQMDQAIIPAGIDGKYMENKEWMNTGIIVTQDHLIYKNNQDQGAIPLRDIYYLDREVRYAKALGVNILNFDFQVKGRAYFGLIRTNNKGLLKRMILSASISNIVIYYVSPYQVGGRILPDPQWKKGMLQLSRKGVMIRESFNGPVVNEMTDKEIFRQSKDKVMGYDAIKVGYERSGNDYADLMFSPSVSLSILQDFFVEVVLKKGGSSKILTDEEKEIMMAIHTGINSSVEISDLMDIEHDKVLEMVDKLVEKEVLTIVSWEKIVELTPQGKQVVEGSKKDM